MSRVILDFTQSLDGYVAGPNVSVDQPMGEGGLRLHDWILGESPSPVDRAIQSEMSASTGAVVLGRRTFDVGIGAWEDTPYPAPSFVVTHRPLADRREKTGTFHFVGEGVERAAALAREAAGTKVVRVLGADVAQQLLKAGLVDEIRIQIAPILLGGGLRLFDDLGERSIDLFCEGVTLGPAVTHLRYRVVR